MRQPGRAVQRRPAHLRADRRGFGAGSRSGFLVALAAGSISLLLMGVGAAQGQRLLSLGSEQAEPPVAEAARFDAVLGLMTVQVDTAGAPSEAPETFCPVGVEPYFSSVRIRPRPRPVRFRPPVLRPTPLTPSVSRRRAAASGRFPRRPARPQAPSAIPVVATGATCACGMAASRCRRTGRIQT